MEFNLEKLKFREVKFQSHKTSPGLPKCNGKERGRERERKKDRERDRERKERRENESGSNHAILELQHIFNSI